MRAGQQVDRGIRTTLPVKNLGCLTLKLLVEQRKLIIVDEHTITELNTFSAKGKSYEAEEGKHDDMVMCLVLFSWLSDQQFFKELTNIDMAAILRERNDEQMEADLLPFGVVVNGLNDPYEDVIDVPQGYSVASNW